MKSRREFVKKGTLAATAWMVANPIDMLAAAASPFTGLTNSGSKFMLLYTANLELGNPGKALRFIREARENNPAILLDAGSNATGEDKMLKHDLSFSAAGDPSLPEYRIIQKGGILTGIVYALKGEKAIDQRINRLATYLKKEKECRVVVCLSQLGYRNKKAMDDLSLAARSSDLDIIIGVHANNPSIRPKVVFNQRKAEVFIHPVVAGAFAIGKIEIDFDRNGLKRHIALLNELPGNQNRAVPSA